MRDNLTNRGKTPHRHYKVQALGITTITLSQKQQSPLVVVLIVKVYCLKVYKN
jgi:hypothetical protein